MRTDVDAFEILINLRIVPLSKVKIDEELLIGSSATLECATTPTKTIDSTTFISGSSMLLTSDVSTALGPTSIKILAPDLYIFSISFWKSTGDVRCEDSNWPILDGSFG